MKILNKYIISSVAYVFFITMILSVLLLLSVDLFSNFKSYADNNIAIYKIFQITILYAPEAIMLVLPPSILFSVTYFLSQLYFNNEMIAIYSTGIPNRKIILPIIFLGSVLSIIFFLFNESIVLDTKVDRESIKSELFVQNSNNLDNYNITIRDDVSRYVIYSNYYKEVEKKLISVILVKLDINNNVIYRLDAPEAIWNNDNQDWVFKNVTINELDYNSKEIIQSRKSKFEESEINLDPNLFKNLSNDINTLEFKSAISILKQQKVYDKDSWYINKTEFYDRIFNSFTAFIMIIIAVSINYRNKKNVFLFSIFNSVIIAVLYYISSMFFQILGRQGIIEPILSVLFPYLIVVLVTYLMNLSVKNRW